MSETSADTRAYHDQSVRLADLTVLEDVIEGVTFENCEILGPAVVILLGSTLLDQCHWTGDADAVIWPAHGRTAVIGAVGLQDCVITGCQFYRVGILVPDDQMAMVRRGFGLG